MSYAHIPETVSDEARELLQLFGDPARRDPLPAADDQSGWDKKHAEIERSMRRSIRRPSSSIARA
jgi:hypothetical protein